jgi:hypothetical protein
MHGWLVERGNRMVDELAAAPWHVVGDLDDLRPDPEPGDGLDPDAVPDAEVLEVAVSFIAAELLARAEQPDTPTASGTVPEGDSSAAEPPSRTALARVVRRLTGRRRAGRASRSQRGTNAQ